MKIFYKLVLIIVGLLTAILIIMMGIKYIEDNTWPKSVPDKEIYFQTGNHSLYFINSDGSEVQKILLRQQIIKPIWSTDSNTIYGLSNPKFSFPYRDIGYPAYWQINEGKYKVCSGNQPYYSQIEGYESIKGQNIVLLSNVEKIIIYNLDACKLISTIIDYEGQLGTYNISGISYQKSTQTLFFGRIVNPYDHPSYQIIKYNLQSGNEEVIGEGINPSVAPDGSKIGYIGQEGIYLLDTNSYQEKLLVRDYVNNINMYNETAFKPIMRWSPDSMWLVAHKCKEQHCEMESIAIIIIRVSDGFQHTIFTGGEYPAWMP